jgi:spoIIIJ-associated protein
MGGQDAIVRVKAKQQDTSRRRRGGRGRGRSRDGSESGNGSSNGGNGGGRAKKEPGTGSGGRSGGQSRDSKPRESGERAPRKRSEGASQRPPRPEKDERTPKKEHTVEVEADRAEQATMVEEFLTGLLGAFGLEGNVSCTIEDDIIIADVSGEQTEALVGPKGVILQSILELSRTIVQRKSQAGARIRLDIAGYGERRREALRIYTGRLVEKILAEGGEIMLEPMNPADRKVVHDAAAELGGVRTFSEGEEPRRSVVIAKED